MMAATRYANERLARLLRLLRPAPEDWLAKAKRIFSDVSVRGEPAPLEAALTDGDVATLRRLLENDPVFRDRFDADPVAAVEGAGMRDLASAIEQETRELVALARRVARDAAYRSALEADPAGALGAAGWPAASAGPLLDALAVADDHLPTAPDVVAHQQEPPSPRARLVLFLLGSAGLVDRIRAEARRA